MCPVNTIDTIVPKNGGSFPVVSDINIQGGIQVQPSTAARDAIPSFNQKVGMLVYVTANSTYYQLTVVGNPGTWVTANLGGNTNLAGDVTGTSAANIVTKIQGTTVSTNSVANDGFALVSVGDQYVPTGISPVFNVKNFGAKGDGITDDTTAIANAITAWSALAPTGFSPILYFPTGIYIVTSTLLVKNIRGAKIRGDGRLQSTIKASGIYANGPVLRRQNCQYVEIEYIGITSVSHTTTFSSDATAGSSTISVASSVNIPTNAVVCLDHIDGLGGGAWRELITVQSIGTGTVTFTTPTANPYLSGDVLCFSPVAGVQDWNDHTDVGLLFNSHGNKCVGVLCGSDSAYALQSGFSVACQGGTGSPSDANNDVHIYDHCSTPNVMWAGFSSIGANALQNTHSSCELSGYVSLYAPVGGSYVVRGGSLNPLAWVEWLGGTASYANEINEALVESGRNIGLLYATGLVGQTVRHDRIKSSQGAAQTTITTVTVTSTSTTFNIANTNGFRPGQKIIVAKSNFSHQEIATVANVAKTTSAPSGYTVTIVSGLANGYASGDYVGVAYGIDVSGHTNRLTFDSCAVGPGAVNTPGQLVSVVDTSMALQSSCVFSKCELGFVGYNLDGCTLTSDGETRWTNSATGGRIETFAHSAVASIIGGSPFSSQYKFGAIDVPDQSSDPTKAGSGGIIYSKGGQPYWIDSSGNVTALIIPNVWRPNDAAGLALWLESDVGVVQSSGVTNWFDLSGNRNDATASGGGKPAYAANILNGLPVIRFDGATSFMSIPDSASLNFGTGSFDVFVVVIPRAIGTFQCVLGKSSNADAANLRFMVTSGNQAQIFWGSDAQGYSPIGAVTASGTAAMIEWGVDATNNKQRTDVGSTASTATITVSGTGSNTQALFIGSDISGNYFAHYDIAAIFAYKANYLNTTDRANLVTYIKNKWGSVA